MGSNTLHYQTALCPGMMQSPLMILFLILGSTCSRRKDFGDVYKVPYNLQIKSSAAFDGLANEELSEIFSARTSSFETMTIDDDVNQPGICGMVYTLTGYEGYPLWIPITTDGLNFPIQWRNNTQSLHVHVGCTLTLFQNLNLIEENGISKSYNAEVPDLNELNDKAQSLKCSC